MLAGAAIGAHSPNVWAAFILGLISHYLLDALPHWEYLTSPKIKGIKPLLYILTDFILGLVIILILVESMNMTLDMIVVSAILGVLLPDVFLFARVNLKLNFLTSLCNFHNKIHNAKKFNFLIGSISQVLIIILSIIAIIYL